MTCLKIALSITIYIGYFYKKICHQELSKIAKSGHTDGEATNALSFLSLKTLKPTKKIIFLVFCGNVSSSVFLCAELEQNWRQGDRMVLAKAAKFISQISLKLEQIYPKRDVFSCRVGCGKLDSPYQSK